MANIDQDLQAIMQARYGRDVRQSIHDAIYDINEESAAAKEAAIDAQDSAVHSAEQAASSESNAASSATEAESYAHGGTSSRPGEDTDNSEYYKEEAKRWAEIAAGTVTGVASWNARSGIVEPEAGDYDIDMISCINGRKGQVPVADGEGGFTLGIGGMAAIFDITSDAGSTVTVTTPSGDVITAEQKTGTTTEWVANTTEYGTHTLTATLNGQTATTTILVDTCKVYMVAVTQFSATITVTYPNSATSCTCVGTNESYTATTNPQTFTVHSADTYTITVTNGTVTETDTVTITTNGQSESVTITYIPVGSTVTPTDDIQTWLNCADIWDKSYTTLSEVLADSTTLSALIADNNAVDYLVRSTTWATNLCVDSSAMSYIGLNNYCANTLLADSTWLNAICNSTYFESVLNVKVPEMTSNTTPSGEVIVYPWNGQAWEGRTFETWGIYNTSKSSASNYGGCQGAGGACMYAFPNAVKIHKFKYENPSYIFHNNIYAGATAIKVYATNDDTAWTLNQNGVVILDTTKWVEIGEYTGINANGGIVIDNFDLGSACKYYAFLQTGGGEPNFFNPHTKRMQYWGREDV